MLKVKNICDGLDCDYEFNFVNGYPITYNDKQLTPFVISILQRTLGKDNVIIPEKLAASGEDFSYFSQRVPSTFIWLGYKSNINKNSYILHNPKFLCDERCIKVGIKSLCSIALNFLS